MNRKFVISFLLFLLLLPTISLADITFPRPQDNGITWGGLLVTMLDIIIYVWQIFVGIAIIMFMIAGIYFLTAQGDPTKLRIAKSCVIWGIVGIVVAIVGFSIVKVLSALLVTP